MATDLWEKNRLAAADILDSWGIDPYDVVVADITEEGYLRFQRTPDGKIRQSATGEAYVDFVEWPKGFPVQVFIGFVQAMHGAVR